jgi:hypothetical protein
LINDIASFFSGEHPRHWAARVQGQLIGVLTWQPGRSYTDNVWLAPSPEHEDQAVLTLLLHTHKFFRSSRPLALNYPAGQANESIQAAGFNPAYTLIWMEMELQPYNK